MRFLVNYTRAIDKMSEWLGEFSKYIVMILIVVGFSNVVLRYAGRMLSMRLTNNSLIELQWYLYSLVFIFCFSYILKHNINVRVDFWFANQSPRRKAMIDLVGHLSALIPFCLLALYVTWGPVLRSWGQLPDGSFDLSRWEVSPDPNGLPRAPIKSMILVAFGTLLLQAIAEVIKLIGILRGQEALFEREELASPLRIE